MSTVLVTGANRGIGLEFVRQYAAGGWTVLACCRAPEAADALKALEGDIHIHKLDVGDRDAVKALAREIDAPLDLVIANAGVGVSGEGSFGDLDYEAWRRFIDVNLFGSVATCEAFTPHVTKAQGGIAVISTKMASIGDASGGAMAYRTSKTALNMATKVIAAALAPSGVAVGVFHPGWVVTDMGGPNGLIDTRTSVEGLRTLIDRMPVSDAPKFLAYDGQEIPW